MKRHLTKKELHAALRSCLRALTNPHLLISLGIAWFITNGWAYCAAGIGWYLHVDWLFRAGAVWLGVLWAPGTPEKLFTFAIAMGVLRLLFPHDTRTLAVVRHKQKALIVRTKAAAERFGSMLRRICGVRHF